jgi:YHS domain-containing protein
MVVAALLVDGLFSALGAIPSGHRPSRSDIFGAVHVDYKLVLNIIGLVIFVGLFWLTARRGATDPVCGMRVDRARALRADRGGRRFYFCSEHCLRTFEHPGHRTNTSQAQPATSRRSEEAYSAWSRRPG